MSRLSDILNGSLLCLLLCHTLSVSAYNSASADGRANIELSSGFRSTSVYHNMSAESSAPLRRAGVGFAATTFAVGDEAVALSAFRSTSAYINSSAEAPALTGRVGGMLSPRRALMDEDQFGDETIDDVSNPNEPGTPVGDTPWLLILLLVAMVAVKIKGSSKKVP